MCALRAHARALWLISRSLAFNRNQLGDANKPNAACKFFQLFLVFSSQMCGSPPTATSCRPPPPPCAQAHDRESRLGQFQVPRFSAVSASKVGGPKPRTASHQFQASLPSPVVLADSLASRRASVLPARGTLCEFQHVLDGNSGSLRIKNSSVCQYMYVMSDLFRPDVVSAPGTRESRVAGAM